MKQVWYRLYRPRSIIARPLSTLNISIRLKNHPIIVHRSERASTVEIQTCLTILNESGRRTVAWNQLHATDLSWRSALKHYASNHQISPIFSLYQQTYKLRQASRRVSLESQLWVSLPGRLNTIFREINPTKSLDEYSYVSYTPTSVHVLLSKPQ